MAEEVKKETENETKKVTREWRVREFKDGFGCVLFETEEGKEPKDVRTTGVYYPDLTGRDAVTIATLCQRFGFNLEDMFNQCRRAESKSFAFANCDRLNQELANDAGNR